MKFEGLQTPGSFKFRGAYNRVVQLGPKERAACVVAWSSGNHAQGVADAARLVGTTATIVMPLDVPSMKIANIRALGAEVVLHDRATESCEEFAIGIVDARAAVLVLSFDDPAIITGQGTRSA